MSTNPTKPDPEAEFEAEFLREFGDQLGVTELSEDAIAKALGLDAFTDEKLEQWFIDGMLEWLRDVDGAPQPRETVVQTKPARPPLRPGPAGPGKRRHRP